MRYVINIALIVGVIIYITYILSLKFEIPFEIPNVSAGNKLVQLEPIEPETESLDQDSVPIGEVSRPVESLEAPEETLNQVSEPIGEASENIDSDIGSPESLQSVTDNDADETLDSVSESAGQASEELPFAPEGQESPMEDEGPQEMPLGDREAEGRTIDGY